MAGRARSPDAGPAGRAVGHLPDDARVRAGAAARAGRAARPLVDHGVQRAAGATARRSPTAAGSPPWARTGSDRSRQGDLRARLRRPRCLQRHRGRSPPGPSPPRGCAHPLWTSPPVVRGGRHGRRPVRRGLHHGGALPRRQRQHAHRRGVPGRQRRHRRPAVAGPRAAHHRAGARLRPRLLLADPRALRRGVAPPARLQRRQAARPFPTVRRDGRSRDGVGAPGAEPAGGTRRRGAGLVAAVGALALRARRCGRLGGRRQARFRLHHGLGRHAGRAPPDALGGRRSHGHRCRAPRRHR